MNCKKCGSRNLVLIKKTTGMRNSLYCDYCLSFQKFMTKEETELYIKRGGKTA